MEKAQTPVERLLLQLLKIDSCTDQEGPIAEFVFQQLTDLPVRYQPVKDNRFNIILEQDKSGLWLVCHMDTVPGKLPIVVTRDKIYGRGACDNKANLAGAILAAKQNKKINLLFTVGEEKDFIGAKTASRIITGPAVIMEPTGFKIFSSQAGVITATIKCRGRQQHSGLPFTKNQNAIHYLTDILWQLESKRLPAFNVGLISGGTAANIVAGTAEATLVIRPQNNREYLMVIKTLRSLRGCQVFFKNQIKPFYSGFFPKPTATANFFSEMAFFPQSILWGAGDIRYAHTEKEHIKRQDLNRLVPKILKLINTLLKA